MICMSTLSIGSSLLTGKPLLAELSWRGTDPRQLALYALGVVFPVNKRLAAVAV
jgi:hypothetical protein